VHCARHPPHNDEDKFNKEYLPIVSKAILDAGGKFIVRGDKAVSLEGAPPAYNVAEITIRWRVYAKGCVYANDTDGYVREEVIKIAIYHFERSIGSHTNP
jgi:hypothetical protein